MFLTIIQQRRFQKFMSDLKDMLGKNRNTGT